MNSLTASILPVLASFYANDNTAFIPELWAQESLAILEENMVMAALVHRDFSDIIASFGDTVNTRKPADFIANRKTDNDSITVQNATSTNVPVVLNQQAHVSFIIKDGEESKSFKDLVNEYLRPAMIANARFVDQVLSAQVYQFLAYNAGGLGTLTPTNAKQYILQAREQLNLNKVPMPNRNIVLTTDSETQILQLDLFIQAQQVGDDGTALREASIGRKLGLNFWMDQNTPFVLASGTGTVAGTVTGAITAGTVGGTSIAVSIAAAVTTGSWVTIVGDMVPHYVTASTFSSPNTTAITLADTIANATGAGAVVTVYKSGTVNQPSSPTGYAAGWLKAISIDGFTSSKIPQVGQMLSFGSGATHANYCVLQVANATTTSCDVVLDRPLTYAIADNDTNFPGPAGSFNFLFDRNALALVSRPLAAPREGVGALSAVVDHNGVGIRVVITYDGYNQGHLVTLDILFGVAVLDVKRGAVLLT